MNCPVSEAKCFGMTFKTHRVFLSVEKQISYSYTAEHNKKLVFKIHVLSILLLKYLLNILDIVCALISQFANINKLNIQLFLLMTFSFFFNVCIHVCLYSRGNEVIGTY